MTDSPHAHGWFCRVMVTGIGVIDPETDVDWVPIVRPDGELTLLDPALIVTTEPAEAGEDAETEPPSAVDILAGALAVLADGMTELDERAPMAPRAASELLKKFVEGDHADRVRAVHPGRRQPEGQAGHGAQLYRSAADQFEHGYVANGKAGILIANNVMAELVDPEPDDLP